MTFFRRYLPHLSLLMACVLGGILMWSLAMLHSEWRAGYVALYQPTNQLNLLKFHAAGAFERIFRPYISSKKSGLPVRRIYLPQQGLLALEQNLPENIKEWQRGFALFPDANLHKVKLRFRGDNPFNWAYEKKSWRMKTRKRDMLEGKRTFNFIKPREASNLNLYLGHFIASETGVLASDVRLIELFINDRSQGVYIEATHLDETFLRAHRIMPVNLYKGEQENQERLYGSEPFLFNNSTLWNKLSVFNQVPEEDRSDLKNLFDIAQKSQTSDKAYNRLKNLAPMNEWARFSAYQTLTQSWHNSSYHNQRLVADPWRGVIYPISHDTGVNFHINKNNFKLDAAKHIISRTFYKSSLFLLQKYQFILDFIDRGLFEKTINRIDELAPKLIESYDRDPSRLRTVLLAELPVSEGYIESHQKLVASIRSNILAFEKWIVASLTGLPNASWISGKKDFSIIVEGTRPVANIQLFQIGPELPSRIVWDKDGNGILSKDDLDLPFRLIDKGIEINATFFANRIHQFKPNTATRSSMITVPTRFRILSNKLLMPKLVTIENPLDGQRGMATKKIKSGSVSPIHLNQPVLREKSRAPLKLSGRIQINDDKVFSVPVNISAGTVIEMAMGASIIFKAGVKMQGRPNSPVVIRPAKKNDVWGAVAISGKNSANSHMRNVILKGGSGDFIDSQRFTAMLSINNTSDVFLENIDLQDSHFFDDMLHIIYSKNIKIENSYFKNANSDAIDIDMSTVRIDGVTIKNSKNDAVDLMSSSVLVENANIIGSGDKGLSVGEASVVLILNSLIKNNIVGVESKDRSIAVIHKSSLIDNNTNLNAYYKNWRYGIGGKVLADTIFLSPSQKPISADKQSSIEIHNIWSSSKIDIKGDVKIDGFKIATNKPKNMGKRLAIIDKILAAWSSGFPEQILP